MTVSTLHALTTALNADALSEMTGREVRAVRLRLKPAVSLMLGLADRATGRTAGWARLLWPVSASKAAKVQRRAERSGLRVLTRQLDSGLILQCGPVATDPKLAPYLERARTHGLLEHWAPHDVLRYNPARRLVLRRPDGVLRIRSASGRHLEEAHRAVGLIVPVPGLKDLDKALGPGHYSLQELCGSTDLEQTPDLADTRRAGELLARLHSSTHMLPERLRSRLGQAPPSAHRIAAAHARTLRPLAPDLAARVDEIAEVLPKRPSGPPVLIHGDASPDQFLRDPGSGRIWLTDFERIGLGPAVSDLGSYLSVCPPGAGRALLEGYEAAGGALPSAAQLRTATALAEVSRLAEPLRHADPDWRSAIDARLTDLEQGGAGAP